jgi:hypothetical protein
MCTHAAVLIVLSVVRNNWRMSLTSRYGDEPKIDDMSQTAIRSYKNIEAEY